MRISDFLKKVIVIGVIGLIISLQLTIFVAPVSAYQGSKTAVADRDAYIDSGWSYDDYADRDSNYGGKDWFLVGQSLGLEESYFHFSFSDIPNNAKVVKAEISLYIYSVDVTMDIRVCKTSNTWDEFKITWNNKPARGQTISTFTAAAKDHYKIDATKFVEGSEISICLYAINPPNYGDCQGSTREGHYSEEDAPQITITYEVEGIAFNEYTIIGIAILIIFIIVILLLIREKRIEKEKKISAVSPEKVLVPPTPPPQPQPQLQAKTMFCKYCGNSISIEDKFCKNCGNKLE